MEWWFILSVCITGVIIIIIIVLVTFTYFWCKIHYRQSCHLGYSRPIPGLRTTDNYQYINQSQVYNESIFYIMYRNIDNQDHRYCTLLNNTLSCPESNQYTNITGDGSTDDNSCNESEHIYDYI